jgi:murein DD-endopeptidase MepM/ murein hydrolase activator NlpD
MKRRHSIWRVVFATLVVLGALQVPGYLAVAGVNEYSAPQWWPLRGTDLVGCARNSPGREGPGACGGNFHPVWAIDVEGPQGQAVYASGSGRARVYSDRTDCFGYGRAIIVNHGGATTSLYAHLSNFAPALAANPAGVWVDANTIIGYVGHTGDVPNCSYNHLHYEESTSGRTWRGATDPGPFQACIGNRRATYPGEWGESSWDGLPGHTFTATNDGTSCGS